MSPGKGSEGPVGLDPADPQDDDLTALYRQAAQDEPPARQDTAILAAAARELVSDAAARAPRVPLWKRLRVPLAFAATALFATTLSVLVEREQSRKVALPASAPPPQPDAAIEQKAETAPKAAPSAAPSADSSKMTEMPRQPSAAFAPPPAPAPAPATAPAAPPSATMSEAPPAQSELRRERSVAEGASRPEAADGAAAEAPASSPARSDQNSAEAIGEMRAKQAAPAAAPEPARPPQPWLDEISRLVDAGKMDEARAALRNFRRAYPDYPLPERLAPLAPAP